LAALTARLTSFFATPLSLLAAAEVTLAMLLDALDVGITEAGEVSGRYISIVDRSASPVFKSCKGFSISFVLLICGQQTEQ
jgi:hypothetical protein